MEISEIERLVELVKDSNISELTLKQGTDRITLKKSHETPSPSQDLTIAEVSEFDDTIDSEFADEQPEAPNSMELIIAPLVGIFANVKPVTSLGAKVKKGQTICVIEAMNIFSDVKAPVSGIVSEVFIEAGHPVEYGQVLYEIRPE